MKNIFPYLISILFIFSCNRNNIQEKNNSQIFTNTTNNLNKPYLVLISLDGFRWDYVERFNPPNLNHFIKNGVKAESLIPSFPSKTFPNHYTVATGMYPENHGLLDNSFYNHEKGEVYKIGNRKSVEDGSWYGGAPIWVNAAKAGMVTASYFFVGSEADVQGIRPSYYFRYDGNVKNEERVRQVVEWLKMPDKKRPHLITMYFSDMDDIGHKVGPNNDEKLKESLFKLDIVLGDLFKEINRLNLPVNIIIVSDHGMLEIPIENYLPIEQIENDELYLTINNGAIAHIYPKNDRQIDTIFNQLKSKESRFKIYKTMDTPQFEHVPKNKSWGAIQAVPDKYYYFSDLRKIALKKASLQKENGEHGFDPNYKEMHGIFYANGPAFKNGYHRPPIKNIHIYPIMCKILGLPIPEKIDGNLEELKDVLIMVNE